MLWIIIRSAIENKSICSEVYISHKRVSIPTNYRTMHYDIVQCNMVFLQVFPNGTSFFIPCMRRNITICSNKNNVHHENIPV